MTELSKCQIPKKELFNFDFGIFFPSSGKASVLLNVFYITCYLWDLKSYGLL